LKSKIFIAAFFTVGCILLYITWEDVQNRNVILRNPIEVNGTIVDIKEIKSEESSSSNYKMVVGYLEYLRYTPNQTFYDSDRFKVGDPIDLIYEDGNPENVMMNNKYDKYYQFMPLLIFGLMLIALSWSIYYFQKD